MLGNAPNYNREATAADATRAPTAAAAGNRPNFAGVYYPAQQGGGAARAPPARRPNEPLPPPTRSSPTSDGSQGRGPDAPKLTPEYLAKWNVLAASRISGSYEYDNIHNCLPPGMPAMMSWPTAWRSCRTSRRSRSSASTRTRCGASISTAASRRRASSRDPTYAGYSTGRWEGDTLVVDTVALTTKSYIDGSSPHSDKMTVQERMRFVEPGVIENQITVNDPEALTEPWHVVRRYRKASYPNDELREFACAEGLRDAPTDQPAKV